MSTKYEMKKIDFHQGCGGGKGLQAKKCYHDIHITSAVLLKFTTSIDIEPSEKR